MKQHLAYIRVSTQRQSDHGISLIEQRRSIEGYASRQGLMIVEWFEEVETAARQGRPVFKELLKRLTRNPSLGLLVHKIDRGVRNLKDWAELGDLVDRGIDVRFTHDDARLDTRSGRLAADIQAVIAADYIRNLREEVKKGIYGRLAQGLYPLPAPIGYVDRGGGVVKTPDPILAPLVIYAFERYATGETSLKSLMSELQVRGFPSVSLSRLLRNPFYLGACRVRGHTYPGKHQPLITAELFARVQKVLESRTHRKRTKHQFRYQGRLTCACGYRMPGERQKQYVYYRCHKCAGVSLREDRIDPAASFQHARTSVTLHFPRPISVRPFEKFEPLIGL